jgi:proline utilization trans-activator
MKLSNVFQIGQAIRLAMTNGWHLDIPQTHFAEHTLERRHKVWWTIYVVYRRMTALQGLPATINSEDVHAQLPSFNGDTQSLSTL